MIRYIKAYLRLTKKDWFDAPKDTTGLTKFTVANDLHIGSKYQDNKNALQELEMLRNDGRTILNGDIFDLSCCPKESVPYLENLVEEYNDYFREFYIHGNHERWDISIEPLKISGGTKKIYGVTHGDLISNIEKWSQYRQKSRGANLFKLLTTDFLDDLDHLKAMRPLPKGFLDNAVAYCNKFHLDGVIVGHFHPEAERRYNHLGKEIIILPAHRINEVWI